MIYASTLYVTLLTAALAAGSPVLPRAVASLDDGAFKEAQQRDDAATRAMSNVQIKASDGRCLFVDALSGDSRGNLTPLQIADCGGSSSNTTGQGFDVITKGKHNDQQGQALVVSSLTQACLSFDARRPADSQVHLFSCGGRADGTGQVAGSQLFAFEGGKGATALTPQNSPGKCLVVSGNKVVIGDCDDKDDTQKFTFGGDAGKGSSGGGASTSQGKPPAPSSTTARKTFSVSIAPMKPTETANAIIPMALNSAAPGDQVCSRRVVTLANTVTVTMPAAKGTGRATDPLSPTANPTVTSAPGKKAAANNNGGCDDSPGGGNKETASVASRSSTTAATRGSNTSATNSRNATAATTTRRANGQHTANPTSEVPVSRGASATLSPTAAAAANQFDTTAQRALESVNLRAADGRCLVIDPTAGDARQNLIPVGLAPCSEDPAQKFDVVTQGKHNDAKDAKTLLVSVLTNGCLNFDSRRPQGDTVTMFSCGGRADGEGQTAASQLFPFSGNNTIVLQPSSDGGQFCLVADKDRLGSTACDNQKDQVFELVEVLQSTADKLLL